MSDSETSKEDRQLPATERRLAQAREDGQVVRSKDLGHLVVIGVLITLLMALGPWLGSQALDLVAVGLRLDHADMFEPVHMVQRIARTGWSGGQIALPVVGALTLLTAGATIAVGGWNLSTKVLEPNFGKLDPMAGLGRLFSLRQLVDHGRVILVASALLGTAFWYIQAHVGDLQTLARMPLERGLSSGFDWFTSGLLGLLVVAVVATLADVPLQIYKHHAELRMTLEEVKKEHKESEGDPHLKGERRRRARAMSRSRMMAAVPTANVIVVNPTHYAVALRYDDKTMQAPRIVAMGVDNIALKIREIAKTAQVPVLDAPPLARALYKHGEVDREIPIALYTAVAQVLAYVARLRTALRMPALPAIEVPAGMDPLEAKA